MMYITPLLHINFHAKWLRHFTLGETINLCVAVILCLMMNNHIFVKKFNYKIYTTAALQYVHVLDLVMANFCMYSGTSVG